MARTSSRPRRNSAFHLPSAFDLFTPSKELVMRHIWIFGPLYAVPLIFGIHDWIWSPAAGQPHHWWDHAYGFSSGGPANPFPDYGFSAFVGASIVWFLIVLIIGTIATVMSQSAQLDAVRGQRLDFQDLWSVTKQLGLRMLGLYIVTAVIVVVGLILLVVPGVIFFRRYYLAPYAMLDKNLSIREALEESATLTKKNTGAIWGVIGVTVLISLISILPFIGGLIAFIFGCLYSIAPAMRYQQLKRLG
ncbi:MAG TPA: hypothetical protein VFP32_01840 [Candidatus Saccharimonadales bacterium]|nr:hypothetical protein [Candidatus Saccharimonadales bacterium]